ncbi:TetR/AcrR family transcriptional regulator [Micromonospora zhanjiangensis]|uniref:TetR/AcrR family transcriptional regulator n=1 Tax=Micromonospora zhanjiangensis TaxID=1522057 RepID=A0ABV8KTN3_9ACTN
MSAVPAGQPAFEDLTTRARIRDAAIRLFTERGIDAATVRDIAKEAGVSAGLIRHHFGSKEALRDACDSYAMDQVNQLRKQMFTDGRLADPLFLVSAYPQMALWREYLLRSMMDGSPAAGAMFDDMVAVGEDWLTEQPIESADPRAYSAVLVAMKVGVFLLREQLSRALGVDVDSPEGQARVTRAFVEIFSQPMINPQQAAQLGAALDQLRKQGPSAPDMAA